MRVDRGSLVLLLVVAGLVAVFVGGLWLPRAHGLAETRRRIEVREAELAQLRAEVADADADGDRTDLTEASRRAARAVPARAELGPLLERLAEDLTGARLVVRQLRARTPVRRDDVEHIPLTLECEGTYPALFAVLDRIESYDRVVRVDGLGVAGGGLARDGADGGDAATLQIDIELTTFCRAETEDEP